MARIRTIKPEFFTSEDVVVLSLGARLLYIAMWCAADREGRFMWRPLTFKMRYFPADDLDMPALARELFDRKLIVLYGDGFAHIPTFRKHQHINPRESASILPAPDASNTCAARVNHASSRDTEAQGGRSIGREGDRRVASCDDATPASGAPHSGTPAGDDDPPTTVDHFIPLNDGSEYAISGKQVTEWTQTYAAVDVPQELREMRQWCISHPKKKKTKVGVLAFANGWLAREQDKPSRRSGSGRESDDPFKGGL